MCPTRVELCTAAVYNLCRYVIIMISDMLSIMTCSGLMSESLCLAYLTPSTAEGLPCTAHIYMLGQAVLLQQGACTTQLTTALYPGTRVAGIQLLMYTNKKILTLKPLA